MVDEVENILREIADRVRAEQSMAPTSQPNGEPAGNTGMGVTQAADSSVKASLERIDSYLTTTGRAWNRLPPVVSNRSGAAARLELWIKNLFKRTTRWYAWEQVNFNAAVDHALRETLSALSVLAEELQSLTQRAERIESELHSRGAEIAAQRKSLDQEIEIRGQEFKDRQAQLESQAMQIAEQRAQVEALTANLSGFTTELLQEQRVSFKQLSLEMSELATLVDRRRREIEKRLGNIEKPSERS